MWHTLLYTNSLCRFVLDFLEWNVIVHLLFGFFIRFTLAYQYYNIILYKFVSATIPGLLYYTFVEGVVKLPRVHTFSVEGQRWWQRLLLYIHCSFTEKSKVFIIMLNNVLNPFFIEKSTHDMIIDCCVVNLYWMGIVFAIIWTLISRRENAQEMLLSQLLVNNVSNVDNVN